MSIKLQHSGGNAVSLSPPTSAPTSSEVAFRLPNADGSANQLLKTDGSGNLGWATDQTGFTPEADSYRITSNFSGSADPIQNNWERIDSTWEGTGYSGSSLITQSSGIWTFAKTGWYIYYLQHDSEIGGGISDGFNQFFSYISTDSGSNWTNFTSNASWFGTNVSTKYMTKTSSALIKVADVSTYRIKVSNSAGSGSTVTKGSTTRLRTGFILLRIGDA